jgi:hypothetical protein
MIHLPKSIETHLGAASVRQLLETGCRPIWAEGLVPVAHHLVVHAAELVEALREARRDRHLVRGLDEAERLLATEQRGLEAAGQKGFSRPSRLLLVGKAGSERFFRNVEGLLRRHAGRLVGLRLEPDFEAIAAEALGVEAGAQALLVSDKAATGRVLLALVGQR